MDIDIPMGGRRIRPVLTTSLLSKALAARCPVMLNELQTTKCDRFGWKGIRSDAMDSVKPRQISTLTLIYLPSVSLSNEDQYAKY